jgi:hypothetical protein
MALRNSLYEPDPGDAQFLGKVPGLKVSTEKGWQEFAAEGARIALHSGPSSPGRKGPKTFFCAKVSAPCVKPWWHRGAKFGKVRYGAVYCLCNGKDPDGNPIQLSDH